MNAKHLLALATLAVVAACSNSEAATAPEQTSELQPREAAEARTWAQPSGPPMTVTGSAIHYFTTAIVHSQQPTEAGMIQRSSDIVQLFGDVEGYVLYHPTSVFDFGANTLVNTGRQVFSGSILGSEPVLLFDDRYRFDVSLADGVTAGEVFLRRTRDVPASDGWYECDLVLSGSGEQTPEGDAVVSYEGTCQKYGR